MPAHFRPLFGPKVTVITSSLPGGTAGTAYSQQLNAVGGTPPYNWVIVGGALPPGITLASGGLLAGTPTVSGAYSFTVQAQDTPPHGDPNCGTASFSVTINPSTLLGPSNMWGGFQQSTSVAFTWWPPTTNTPDSYNVYQDGSRIATGITPDPNMGGGGTPQPWYVATGLANSATHNFTVTAVTGGVESAQGPILTMTTLAGATSASSPPTLPTPALAPESWIQPFSPTTTGTTWTATNTANNTAAGTTGSTGKLSVGCGFQYALNNAALGDTIILTAGATYSSNLPPWAWPLFTGSGWINIVSSQAPEVNVSGALPAFTTTQADPDYEPFTFTGTVALGATSATLSAAWPNRSGYHQIRFSDNEKRKVLVQNGQTSADWSAFNGPSPGLTAGVTASVGIATLPCVTPFDIPNMPTVTFTFGSQGVGFALPQAINHLRFIGINLQPAVGVTNQMFYCIEMQLSTFGSLQTSGESLYVDRCIIGKDSLGDTVSFIRHGIGVNCNHFLAHQCYFWGLGQVDASADSNAIFVGGGGPGCIQNCYLEAMAEGAIFGGIFIDQTQIMHDWVYRWNFNGKPQSWLAQPSTSPWQKGMKNHFELKCCQRAQAYGNVHDTNSSGSASQGQHGRSFVIGARDQTAGNGVAIGKNNPWNLVTDVDIHDNRIYDVDAWLFIFTGDVSTSAYTARVRAANNQSLLSPPLPGDNTFGIWLFGPNADITLDHNTTIINTANPNVNSFATSIYSSEFGSSPGSYATPLPYTPNRFPRATDRALISNNIMDGRVVSGDSLGSGTAAVNVAFTNYTWLNNLLVSDNGTYPATSLFAAGYANIGFQSFPNNSTQPVPPQNWNVVSGTYSTSSTTGGPVGTIISTAQPQVNWAPGHYLQFGENDTAASRVATINALPSQPGGGGIVGVIDVWIWSHLEGSTAGSYTFTDPNSVIAACKAKGLKYILDTASRAFGSASFTGIIPQYVINNNWTYTRPAGPAAGGATVWVPGCMTAKTNLELAFVQQTGFLSNYVTGTNPTMMGWSSDESVIGASLTTSQPYSAAALVSAEINQRWTVLRQAVPQLAVILYTNFMTSDDGSSTNMKALFTNAATIGGILVNGGPDCFAQNVPGSSETAGQQVLDGQIGGVNYCGPAWGVLGGVQNAEQGATTFQKVFDAFNNHFQAQYQQWYEAPTWGSGGGAALKTFLTNNPVTNTSYPQNWPGAVQPSFTQVVNFPNFSGAASSFSTFNSENAAVIQGNNLNITGGSNVHQVGYAWYKTPVNVSQFRTDFTFQIPTIFTGAAINGFALVIQNSNNTTNPPNNGNGVGLTLSGDANLCGFGAYWYPLAHQFQYGAGNAVCIKFDQSNINGAGSPYNPNTQSPNSTGVYVDTGPSAGLTPGCDLNPFGINFYSGHVFAVSLVYDGAILTQTIKDLTTNAQSRISWPIAIPTIVGGNTATVGFTAGQAGNNAIGANLIQSWSWNGQATNGSLARINTPTFSLAPAQYTASQTVSISGPPGSSIFYTTNGQAPTSSSTAYSGPITISASTFLQAVAVQSGFSDSQVASAYYQISASAVPNINFPSGFSGAGNLLSLVGFSAISGSSLQLIQPVGHGDPPNGYVGCAWFPQPMSVGNFTAQFTFQMGPITIGNSANMGMTFCIQNQPPVTDYVFNNAPPSTQDGTANTPDLILRKASGGPLTYANGGGFGYSGSTNGSGNSQISGIARSVALKFDASNNTTGVYQNGADIQAGSGGTGTGFNFTGGHQFQVNLTYTGPDSSPASNLKVVIKDLTTNTTVTLNFPVNIPSVVGSSLAYVGFTAGAYYDNLQEIVNWTWTS